MTRYHFDVLDHTISVEVEDGEGEIITTLHDEIDWERDNEDTQHVKNMWNTYVDAIESMILAHACAGIDIGSREYREGIEVALDSCGHQL